jgi:corrinoid protein of di/trimethylamine methyltransferase
VSTDVLLRKLEQAVEVGDEVEAPRIVRHLLDQGAVPLNITDALSRAMGRLGEKFHRLDIFVPDLLVAADAFEAAMRVVEPALESNPREPKGVVVIGVVEGDIHTLGKNLVRVMLAADGFTVHDVGRDVSVRAFVDAAEANRADIIAMSSLMTTTMGRMKDVVDELAARGKRDRYRVLVGGAPVTLQFAKEIGADGYGEDAADAVAVANRLAGGPAGNGRLRP